MECRDNQDCSIQNDTPLCDIEEGKCISCPEELPNWDAKSQSCTGCNSEGDCRVNCYCDSVCGTCHSKEGTESLIRGYEKSPEERLYEDMWLVLSSKLPEGIGERDISRVKEIYMRGIRTEEGIRVLQENYPYSCVERIEIGEYSDSIRYNETQRSLQISQNALNNRLYDPEGMSKELIKSLGRCQRSSGGGKYYRCRVDIPSEDWAGIKQLYRLKEHIEKLEKGEIHASDYEALKQEYEGNERLALRKYILYVLDPSYCGCEEESIGAFEGEGESLWSYIERSCMQEEGDLLNELILYNTQEVSEGSSGVISIGALTSLPDDIHNAFLDKALSCVSVCKNKK